MCAAKLLIGRNRPIQLFKNAIISQIIPIFQEESWNQQCKVYSDDINGKLDRSELDPLKEWLLSRLDALNDKLMTQNQAPVDWVDNAAGIRR